MECPQADRMTRYGGRVVSNKQKAKMAILKIFFDWQPVKLF